MFLQVTQYLPLYSMFSDADVKGFSDKKLGKSFIGGQIYQFFPNPENSGAADGSK